MVICDNIGNDRLFIRKFNIDIWKKIGSKYRKFNIDIWKKIVKITGNSILIYEKNSRNYILHVQLQKK